MRNPYTNRSTIRDPAMFFGRTSDLTRIYAMLANTQSVSIVGDRRIGKSSLLYCLARPEVQARIGRYDFSNYFFIHIDLQGSVYKKAVEFLQYLLDKIRLQIKEDWLPAIDQAAESQDAFETTIGEINRRGFKLVLLMDEFDYVTRNERFNADFFSFMRYIATNYDLSIVTVSQKRLAELCHIGIADSPFFNIFAVVSLDALTGEEARELMTIPSLKAGYPLADDAGWLLELAGTQPIFVQIACFYLLEARAGLSNGEEPDYEAVRQLFYGEARDHFEYAWTHLTEAGRQRLQPELWQDQGPYHHYLATSGEFRRFVRQKSGWQESKEHLINEKQVEEALKTFWRVTDLGQCSLADLNLVKRQLIQNGHSRLGPNVGRALQDVLKTAIEHLGTANEPRDKASKQWRHWFILQQCYVEETQNKHIVLQLNIAERTFYRERAEAIKALTHVLQELELNLAA